MGIKGMQSVFTSDVTQVKLNYTICEHLSIENVDRMASPINLQASLLPIFFFVPGISDFSCAPFYEFEVLVEKIDAENKDFTLTSLCYV